MNDKMKPALIGGLLLGILSAIPAVDYCCCLWAIAGGVVASHLYIKGSPTPVKPADGAILGAMAGAVGVALIFVIGIPLQLIVGTALRALVAGIIRDANPAAAAQMMAAGVGFGAAIVHALMWSVVTVALAVGGGVIGVALFEKRKGGPAGAPPPPPPGGGYGGGNPGGGYSQGL